MLAGMHKDDSSGSGDAAKGGIERAKRLSPEQRSAIARTAASVRWGGSTPRATHEGVLRLGDFEIPCYVLSDGKRVLSQNGVIAALGMKQGSNPRLGGDRLSNFSSGKGLKPFISDGLSVVIQNPIAFVLPNGGSTGHGFPATSLVELCESVLEAREANALQAQQAHIARACEILVRGFARVGITALVDEATGYQADRARDALAKILEEFIADELRKWVKTFPTEYYRELFRLRGMPFPPANNAKPSFIGHLTNNVVYKRLAPGVLNELKRVSPRDEKGRLKHKYHQRLTDEVGHPKLREHLASVVTLMRISKNFDEFIRHLDKALPQFGSTMELRLDEEA